MAITQVNMYSDVYWACLTHALSTDKEEIMGLLIGSHDKHPRGLQANLEALVPLRRSDKRPDRVEISPEQQCEAANYAEGLRGFQDRQLRVCGWYHSHPHITVHPSHVDVNTQSNYQLMDPSFVGLIFSVFSNSIANNKMPGKLEVKCFQAENIDGNNVAVEVTLNIIPRASSPPCLKALISLPRILFEEQKEAQDAAEAGRLDLVTVIGNETVFTKALCGITETISAPLFETLSSALRQKQDELDSLLV